MTLEQMKLMLPLLEQFSEHLSAMSCNDWHLPNSPTGKALWTAINTWSDPQDTGEWILDDMSKEQLFMPDFTALDYMIHCIKSGLIKA